MFKSIKSYYPKTLLNDCKAKSKTFKKYTTEYLIFLLILKESLFIKTTQDQQNLNYIVFTIGILSTSKQLLGKM